MRGHGFAKGILLHGRANSGFLAEFCTFNRSDLLQQGGWLEPLEIWVRESIRTANRTLVLLFERPKQKFATDRQKLLVCQRTTAYEEWQGSQQSEDPDVLQGACTGRGRVPCDDEFYFQDSFSFGVYKIILMHISLYRMSIHLYRMQVHRVQR